MEHIIKAKIVKQKNQEFLIGVFKIKEILNFTRYTERLIVDFREEESDDPTYDGQIQIIPEYNSHVQRKTNNAKVERIADYLIYDPYAMFPTNIVIAIPQQVIDKKEGDGSGDITIFLNKIVKQEIVKEQGDVFLTIIDGQHRIRGIERAIQRVKNHIDQDEEVERNRERLSQLMDLELIVTFFVDPILEYQATIFSTINKTQTRVPENLVYSLFGLTNEDTPQKTSLEVVLALNGLEKSPFFKRVRLVGGNYKRGENVPLSQATMVKTILLNICENQRAAEIERTQKRSDLLNINDEKLIFRKYYATDSDKMIVRIMYSFFSAVKDSFVDVQGISYWTLAENTAINVLHTNVGFQALMKILSDLILLIPEEDRDKKNIYMQYLRKAGTIEWGNTEKYPFTSKTIKALYQDIKQAMGI